LILAIAVVFIEFTDASCSCDDIIEGIYLSCNDRGLSSINFSDWTCQNQLNEIYWMDLSYNELETLSFLAGFSFPNMSSLYIGNNKLSVFDTNATMPRLEFLICPSNHFAQLNSFPTFENLFKFDLRFNLMSAVDANVINGIAPNLAHLFFDGNPLTQIWNAFDLPNLRILHLVDNNLASLEFFDSGNITNLQELSLDGNLLTSLDTESVFPFLKEVSIRNNLLSMIDFEMLTLQMPQLQKLKLSKNKLALVKGLTDSSLLFLEELALDNNQLNNLPGITTAFLPRLKSIECWENSFENMDFFSGGSFQQVEELFFEFNNLSNIEGVVQGRFSNLKYLGLLGNDPLNDLDILSEYRSPNLVKLMVSPESVSGSSCKAFDFFRNFIVDDSTYRCTAAVFQYVEENDDYEQIVQGKCDLSGVSNTCAPTTASPSLSPTLAPSTLAPSTLAPSTLAPSSPTQDVSASSGLSIGAAVGVGLGSLVAGFAIASLLMALLGFKKASSDALAIAKVESTI